MRSPTEFLLGTFCLLLLSKSFAENGWKLRVEHTFALDGRTVAGFPSLGHQQHTGVHYKGIVSVQRDITGFLLLKFQNMTYTKFNQNLPEGWWSSRNTEWDTVKELPLTTTTVAVKLGQNGPQILIIKAGLHDWEINFIQGIINQLHTDFSVLQRIHRGKDSHINIAQKVMENSMFGRCEVLYEMKRIPRAVAFSRPQLFPSAQNCRFLNFLEIFKTRNFTNCEYSAEFHFGLPASKKCHPGGNECGDFWNRASVTRITGCGDQSDFRILQSETNSRVITNLHLHKGSEASVSSYVTMNVVSVKHTSRRFSLPNETVELRDPKFKFTQKKEEKDICHTDTHDKKDTVGENEEETRNKSSTVQDKATDDIWKTVFSVNLKPTLRLSSNKERNQWEFALQGLHNPPHQPLIPYASVLTGYEEFQQKSQKFKEIIADIAKDFENSKEIYEERSLEKVLAAVRLCRTMTYFDLKRAVENVLQPWKNRQKLSESKLYRDVLVMCGTNPTFHILKTWIEERKLEGEDASAVVATMPAHLQTPSPDVISEFYELIQSSAVRGDKQLKMASVLAFSHLLRAACVDKKFRYAHYTDEVFDATCEFHQTSRYVSWLASMLQSDSSLKRVYVAALGNTGSMPALHQLQSIAHDMSVSPYLRAAAVISMKYQALRFPNETSSTLLSLYRDVGQPVAVRVAAVALALYTKPALVLLQRIAVSTWYDPSMAVAAFVRSSLTSLAKLEDPLLSELSRNARVVVPLVRPVPLGIHTSYNVLWSKVSTDLQQIVMNQLSYDGSLDATNLYYRHTQRLGGLSRIPLQGEIAISNPDHFLTMLGELIYPSDDTSQARPAISDLERSTKWLKEKLTISQRDLPTFEGDFRVQFGQFVERIFPLDKDLPVELARAGRKLVEEMKVGRDFHYQKVDKTRMLIAVVTELGIPVNFEVTVPWAVRLAATAQMDVQSKTFETDVDMMYTSQLLSEISFLTAWDDTVHMAASHGVSVLRLPPTKITASVPQNSVVQLALQVVPTEEKTFLLQHSSTPFTSQNSIFDVLTTSSKKPSSVVHSTTHTKEWNMSIPNIRVTYKTEGPNLTPISWLNSGINVMGHLMMWPSLEASWIEVKLDGLNSVTSEVTVGRAAGNNSLKFTEERLNKPMELQSAISRHEQLNMTSEEQGANSTQSHLNMNSEEQGANSTQSHLNMTSEEQGANSTQSHLIMTSEEQGANRTQRHLNRTSEEQGANSTQGHLNMTSEEQGANSTQGHLNMTSDEQGANSTQDHLNITSEQQGADSTQEYITSERPFPIINRMNVSNLDLEDTSQSVTAPSPKLTTSTPYIQAERSEMPRVIAVNDTYRSHGHFKAPSVDPFAKEVNGSHYGYLLIHVLEGIDYGNAHVVGLNVHVDGTQPKKFSTLWTYAAGRSGRIRRFGAFLKEAEWQAGFTFSLAAPTTPMLQLRNVLQANVTPSLQADLVYGNGSRMDYQVSLQAVMEHNAKKKNERLVEKCIDKIEKPETDVKPECVRAALDAMFMDKYNVTVTYNEKFKNNSPGITQYFNYLRYWLLPYVTEDTEDVTRRYFPTNWIKGVLEIAPSLDTVSAWIQTPSSRTNFSNVPVNQIIVDTLRFNPAVSYLRRLTGESYCAHGGTKFSTFDREEFDYNISSCWHLLAKDCSGESRFAILMRSAQNNETEVEVNLDNYQIVHLRPGPHVSVNKKPLHVTADTVVEITDKAGIVILHVDAAEWPERVISMNMPAHGLHVMYTGSNTIITANSRMRGRLCGICGDYDGDTINEFRKPQNNQAHNSQEYASSYAIMDSDCSSSQSEQ